MLRASLFFKSIKQASIHAMGEIGQIHSFFLSIYQQMDGKCTIWIVNDVIIFDNRITKLVLYSWLFMIKKIIIRLLLWFPLKLSNWLLLLWSYQKMTKERKTSSATFFLSNHDGKWIVISTKIIKLITFALNSKATKKWQKKKAKPVQLRLFLSNQLWYR